MPAGNPFPEEPSDTRTAIMRATFDALVEYGYAGLTIDRIGEFFPKSKSLLYHHYDGKDDLLVDFLERLIERREAAFSPRADVDAQTRLERLLDGIAAPETSDADRGFSRALVELRAQAAHDEDYREHFTKSDELFREWIADIVRDGIEEGVFRSVDPEQVAATIHMLAGGILTERVTSDDPQVDAVRAELDAYLEARLLRERSDVAN